MIDNSNGYSTPYHLVLTLALSIFYVLGKVLAPCSEFALNYLDDIMIISRTWEEHLKHLEAADL